MSGRTAPTHIESSVTKLLVATRQLLEALTQWSNGRMTDIDVSDVFVRTGNELNAVITAFGTYGIDMDDLVSVPQDLRNCLESVLSLDASPDNLEVYLPSIRQIIVTLLQGLKTKQAVYRRTVQERQSDAKRPPDFSGGLSTGRAASEPPREDIARPRQPSVSPSIGILPSERRTSTVSRAERPESSASLTTPPNPTRHPDRRNPPSRVGLPSRNNLHTGVPLPPAPPDAFRPPRQRSEGRNTPSPDPSAIPFPVSTSQPVMQSSGFNTSQTSISTSQHVRHQLSDKPVASLPNEIQVNSGNISTPPGRRRSPPTMSRFSVDSDFESPKKPTGPGFRGSTSDTVHPSNPQTPQISLPPSLPPLLDLSSGSFLPESSQEAAKRMPRESPAALASLTALQNSEQLSRRASKRYSQYQFKQMLPTHSKMPSSSGLRQREGSVGVGDGSPQRPVRRVSRPVPPLPSTPAAAPQAVQPKALGEPFQEASTPYKTPSTILEHPRDGASEAAIAPTGDVPAVFRSPQSTNVPDAPTIKAPTPAEPPITPTEIRVFLQYGRDTKRVMLDLTEVTSVVDLQGVFISKFDYSPGAMELFPDVYIKDPTTGIAYHLEEMEDIKQDCLLSLNVDPLDQVKQHFDTTITTLSHEIRDLKNNFVQGRRLSALPTSTGADLLSPSLRPTTGLSDRQPSRNSIIGDVTPNATTLPLPPSIIADGPRPAGSTRLHDQFAEVQTLRRDLGVMRQVYVDFVSQTKSTFQTIRDQTQAVREVALTKLQGSRAMVDAGKGSLESHSQDTVQAVEEISDIVDAIKDDVLKRQIMPKPGQMASMRETLDKVKAQVSSLQDQLSLAAPAWKQTWNQELKNVVDEQQLLRHQEGLAADLAEDISQASEMFETLEQYVAQRQQGMVKSLRTYQPPESTNAGESVPNLLLEIRTKENDPNRRLRAIEQQQKAREKELATKTDDFSNELNGFVAGGKLKKTGGTEEAERLRQKRQEQSLKRMFETKGSPDTLNSPGTAKSDISSPPVSSRLAPERSEKATTTDDNDAETAIESPGKGDNEIKEDVA